VLKGRPGPWRRAHEAPCRSHHRCPDRHRASGTVGSIFLRPICASNAAVVARARVNYAGRSLGLAEALVQDGHGRVLGHATTRCFLFDSGVRDGGATDVAPPGRDVDEPTCDPYLRPVRGGPVPDVVWAERSRLEVIEGFRNRELPVLPVSHFFGLRVLSAEAGRILMPARPRQSPDRGSSTRSSRTPRRRSGRRPSASRPSCSAARSPARAPRSARR